MHSPPLTPISPVYKVPPFSVSKASTIHAEKNARRVEIFQYMPNGHEWKSFEESVENVVDSRQKISSPSIIFASSLTFESKELMGKLCKQYDIPHTFWAKTSRKASGYFGCSDSFDDAGNMTSYNMWLRFIVKMTKDDKVNGLSVSPYHWEKIKVFTKFEAAKSDIMLCFDTPPVFRNAVKEAVSRQYVNLEIRDPYLMLSILVAEVVSLFDTSVWSLRDLVRSVEQTRDYKERPQPDYYHFHEISRHVIHSTETLAISVKTFDSMIEQHRTYLQEIPLSSGKDRASGRRIQQSLQFQKSLVQCLKGRSEALGLRLQNEINLAFNTVSQHDSQIAVKIGQAAQADSASMRAISVLTFLFFPGTFISSILGMEFFSFSPGDDSNPQSFSVSNKLWIFFAFTIPLTFITGLLWLLWERRYDQKRTAL